MGNNYAVLWDMDGVLVDSGELHYQSWLETLTALSIPFDREKFRHTFGLNNADILTILLGKPPSAEYLEMVSDHKEALFRQMLRGQLQLLPGAFALLEGLQGRGNLQAVASSAPYANIEAIVDELNIRKYFSALISAAAMPGKPNPMVFLEAARQLGVEPKRCVVIEDAVAGVEAAKNAGMKCIAVTTTHPRADLTAADKIVNSLDELSPDDLD